MLGQNILHRILVLVILVFGTVVMQAQSTPYFGADIPFLKLPHPATAFLGKLSPDGRFVVALSSSGGDIYPELYIWDLHLERSSPKPPPTHRLDLHEQMTLPQAYVHEQGFAFSPDASRLALLLQDRVWILGLPELNLQAELTFHEALQYGEVAWWDDNNLLGIAGTQADSLTIWDITSDVTYGYVMESPMQFTMDLMVLDDLWIMRDESSFVACTARLDDCREYAVNNNIFAIDHQRQTIVTASWYLRYPTRAWGRVPNTTEFIADDTHYADLVPVSFSPNGRYMMTLTWTEPEQGQQQQGIYSLWDLKQNRALHKIASIGQPVWVASDDLYVDSDGFRLYQPDMIDPIATLSNLYDLINVVDDTEIGYYHTVSYVRDVSDDGSRYLLPLGSTAIVVPIIRD